MTISQYSWRSFPAQASAWYTEYRSTSARKRVCELVGGAGRCTTFSLSEICDNVHAVARWNTERFEIPDVIGFQDIAYCAAAFASDYQARRSVLPHGTLLRFPYPNTPTKLRWFSIAQPEDLVLLRTAAGRIALRTDRLLSTKVFSHRLRPASGCWAFQNPGRAWEQFTLRGIELLHHNHHAAMCRTDVASYYASISLESLASMLRNLRCESSALWLIVRVLGSWHHQDSQLGLPIGIEASAVLGNAFLKPVDDLIEKLGVAHLRYGDDVLLFGDSLGACDSVLPPLDNKLDALGLTRSIEKTLRFDDRAAAIRNLRSAHLASLSEFVRLDNEAGMDAVHRAFDEEVLPGTASPSDFRWVVKTLTNRQDKYACRPLAQNTELMNFDPRASADYLKNLSLQDQRVVDGAMERLTQVANDKFDGLDLHLLRAMSSRSFGGVEATEFRRIATDASRRWPVRNWAWHAYARTSGRYVEMMEAARSEDSAPVRRAIVVALKGHAKRTFVRHVSQNFGECRYAVRWLDAA